MSRAPPTDRTTTARSRYRFFAARRFAGLRAAVFFAAVFLRVVLRAAVLRLVVFLAAVVPVEAREGLPRLDRRERVRAPAGEARVLAHEVEGIDADCGGACACGT